MKTMLSGIINYVTTDIWRIRLKDHPRKKMRIVLNSEFWSDLVSDISRLVKYMFLSYSASNIDWDTDDREARLIDGEYYKHNTPGFVDGITRLKYDGFLYDNFEYLLK